MEPTATTTCQACGAANAPGAPTCGQCGKPLASAAPRSLANRTAAALLVVAIIQGIFGPFQLWLMRANAHKQAGPAPQIPAWADAIAFGGTAALVAIAVAARFKPLLAAGLAWAVFVGLWIFDAVQGIPVSRGLLLRVLALALLTKALQMGSKHRESAQRP